ncbi:MAG TPA: choice-of-anchor tandem repeat GloVer-containing protein [Bacteroidia bacterium]|nr:choice-of-anchor tandem repeat GloVer-containing protein [Bacteroidia bacterium]
MVLPPLVAPFGSITFDGTYIYGTTNQGGINGKGVVFKVKPDGSVYDTLMNFSNAIGANPVATPYYDGTYIYTTTLNGGANNMGTICRVKSDGTGDTAIFNFSTADGYQSLSAVILVRGHLYGMTSKGGTSEQGVIFRIKPDGTNYTKLFDFNGTSNGSGYSSFISDGTFLYGTTPQGGTNNFGTIFKLKIPVITNNQNPTVCQGQSVTVSNHTYSVTGNYADTLFSTSQDCDSIINTNLTVLSSSSSTSQSYTLCSGQSVNVGTDVYTTSGTYTYTYSGGSCDSIITTNLTVNPSPTLTINGSTQLCANNNNGTTLTASGGGTYNWSTGSQADSISVTPTTNTTYSLIATLGSCTDTASVTVNVNHVTAAFNYAGVTCSCPDMGFMDSSYVSPSDSIVSWSWSFPGGNPSTSNVQNPGVTFSYGTHHVCLIVTTANGCVDSTCSDVFESIQAIEEYNNPTIQIYPNPAQNNFAIKTNRVEKQTLTLFDVRGKLIFTQLISGTTSIDVSRLADGIYNLSIIGSTEVVNKKIVVVH